MSDQTFLSDLVALAQKRGASAADAVMFRSASLSVAVRLGKTETVERSEAAEIGLRVFVGKKQGIISTSDLRPENMTTLVSRVLAMAEANPEDSFAGLADEGQLCRSCPDLDLCDGAEPQPDHLLQLAGECEAAALAVPGVSNSQGGNAGWSRTDVSLVGSNGFSGSYARTSSSLSAVVLAGSGTEMERDYDYDVATHLADLREAAEIGRKAGERVVRRLSPRMVPSGQYPVVYEARQGRDLLGAFLGGINGAVVARGATFLKDRMGQPVFSPSISIVDDPSIMRGMASRPFDAEGLLPRRRTLVEEGLLKGWLLDLRSARQLGLEPSGNAVRGLASPPSPGASNVWIENGTATADDLIADIKQGLYLTDTLGHGHNLVTGDYSRGAGGYWIENGKPAFPVSGLTVAGNLADMFRQMTPANDLNRRFGADCPTLRVDGMTVAGK